MLRSYAGVLLAGAAVAPPGGLLLAPATSAPAGLKPVPLMTSATIGGAPPPLALPAPSAAAANSSTGAAAARAPAVTTAAAPVAPVKQAPGSGQQMFQQMFALLKQMLPVEQYATLHSEMRKGNGNDIKSIVEIIKRIAGDAIFSSVIQKMDLTRTLPTAGSTAATTTATAPVRCRCYRIIAFVVVVAVDLPSTALTACLLEEGVCGWREELTCVVLS